MTAVCSIAAKSCHDRHLGYILRLYNTVIVLECSTLMMSVSRLKSFQIQSSSLPRAKTQDVVVAGFVVGRARQWGRCSLRPGWDGRVNGLRSPLPLPLPRLNCRRTESRVQWYQ